MPQNSQTPPAAQQNSIIPPTVGRVVWLWMAGQSVHGRPHAAMIAYVHTMERVNVGYLDAHGVHRNAVDVLLVQDGQEPPQDRDYCAWMPYQLGQARRT